MNLIFSYNRDEDLKLEKDGHTFLGAGVDQNASEVHVFLKKDAELLGGYRRVVVINEDPMNCKEAKNCIGRPLECHSGCAEYEPMTDNDNEKCPDCGAPIRAKELGEGGGIECSKKCGYWFCF